MTVRVEMMVLLVLTMLMVVGDGPGVPGADLRGDDGVRGQSLI
jgi:hypothetical protein